MERMWLDFKRLARLQLNIAARWLKTGKNLLIAALVLLFFLYLGGFITQFPHNKEVWEAGGGISSDVAMKFPSLNPFVCIWTLAQSKYRSAGLLIVGTAMTVFGLLFYFRYNDPEAIYDEERNFYYSKKGLYGTAGWMEKKKIGLVLDITPENQVESVRGDILGIDEENNLYSVPTVTMMNRHVAVFGASGTMKSRAYSRNKIILSALNGESLVVTDPKGELLEDTAEYLRKQGYEIRILNLVSPELSSGWNFMLEVERGGDMMAQTIADVIIRNTGGPKPDHFWDNAEMNLLKALMLYVAENSKLDTNMTNAYRLLTQFEQIEDLTALFNAPTVSPAALQPYNLFLKANENVRGNVMIGLGSRLQVFQNQAICRMTERDDIDLEAPVKRKCAYYCIMSDQDSTLNFISSLFFSMLFIKLVRYVDTHCKGALKGSNLPVNFVLDEFPNIGLIPDFTKKISTIRSRKLNVAVIFQNLTQLENRYPDGQWEEILGNCDVQLFLGCTDLTTAEYISKRSGQVTVVSSTKAKEWNEMSAVEYQPHYRESKTLGKRFLLNADEVLTLPIENCLLILRGQKILKAQKFDYTRHPQSRHFEPIEVLNYNPVPQKDTGSPPESPKSSKPTPAKPSPEPESTSKNPKPLQDSCVCIGSDGKKQAAIIPNAPGCVIDLGKAMPLRKGGSEKPDIGQKK